MNSWPDALIAETALQPATLCRIFVITPLGREPIYFTDHDQPVTLDDITYRPNDSFTPSAIQNQINGAAANLEIDCLLGSDGFTYEDCIRQVPLAAAVLISLCSWANLTAGQGVIFEGTVTSLAMQSNVAASLSCGGGTGIMDRQLTEVYSPTCRADLGDSRCTVDLTAFSLDFTAGTPADDMTFASDATAMVDGKYNLGSIRWLAGANAGQSQEVAFSMADGTIHLFYPPRFAMVSGDTGTIYQGCDKTVANCIAYDNLVNFRGEPYVPGDALTTG